MAVLDTLSFNWTGCLRIKVMPQPAATRKHIGTNHHFLNAHQHQPFEHKAHSRYFLFTKTSTWSLCFTTTLHSQSDDQQGSLSHPTWHVSRKWLFFENGSDDSSSNLGSFGISDVMGIFFHWLCLTWSGRALSSRANWKLPRSMSRSLSSDTLNYDHKLKWVFAHEAMQRLD